MYLSINSTALATTGILEFEPSNHGSWSGELLYGQTSEFWSTVDQITHGPLGPTELKDLIDHLGQDPDEGILTLAVKYETPNTGVFQGLFSHVSFALRADYLAGGEVRNRVLPELLGYEVFTGEVSYGFRLFRPYNDSGWNVELRTLLGIGEEEVAEGFVADFYPKAPIDQSSLFYWGVDFTLGYQGFYHENLKSSHQLKLMPTLFHSNFSDSHYQFQVTQETTLLRWKWKSDWVATYATELDGLFEIGFHSISGPQPIPVEILPRVWDSIHEIEVFPTVGSMIGLGGEIRFLTFDQKFLIEAMGGFYGGYFGAGAKARYKALSLAGGTWGLERTSGYRLRESRIQYISLGFTHVL